MRPSRDDCDSGRAGILGILVSKRVLSGPERHRDRLPCGFGPFVILDSGGIQGKLSYSVLTSRGRH